MGILRRFGALRAAAIVALAASLGLVCGCTQAQLERIEKGAGAVEQGGQAASEALASPVGQTILKIVPEPARSVIPYLVSGLVLAAGAVERFFANKRKAAAQTAEKEKANLMSRAIDAAKTNAALGKSGETDPVKARINGALIAELAKTDITGAELEALRDRAAGR